MDTIINQRMQYEKNVISVLGLTLAFCMLIIYNANIIASGVEFCITGISPSLNYIKKNEKNNLKHFENIINAKYANYSVTEVEKGIKHIQMTKFYNKKPVRINIVELSETANNNLVIAPVVASETSLANRRKINAMSDSNTLVAINGGYFKPQTGMPLGTLIINQKLYTSPIYDRVAIGFFDDGYDMARLQLNAELKTNKGGIKIDNINQPRMLSTHTIVYTKDWGKYTPTSPKYGTQIVIENNKIIKVAKEPQIIPINGYVVVGPEKVLNPISQANKLKLITKLTPNWENVNHVISGGPYLVKNNEIYVDTAAQKLEAINGRNPRTAIGYTQENHLILVTVDGREGSSIGLTLNELANLMKSLGCINAMNLDGGGSTIMSIKNKIVNKPAVQGGIPLSHALVVKKIN